MSMARLNVVHKARKAQGVCGKCRQPINAGDAYVHWSFRYGGRKVRCAQRSCQPADWERESNALRQSEMQGAEAHSLLDSDVSATDASANLSTALDFAREIAETLQERVSSQEGTNLEYTQSFADAQESAEAFEDYVNEAEGVVSELDDLGEPPTEDDYPAADFMAEAADEDEAAELAADAYAEALADYENALAELVSGLPDWPELLV